MQHSHNTEALIKICAPRAVRTREPNARHIHDLMSSAALPLMEIANLKTGMLSEGSPVALTAFQCYFALANGQTPWRNPFTLFLPVQNTEQQSRENQITRLTVPNVAVKWLAHLLRILEVLGLYLCSETDYTNWFVTLLSTSNQVTSSFHIFSSYFQRRKIINK